MTSVAFCNRCSSGLRCPSCDAKLSPSTNLQAGHPAFMEVVSLKTARDAIDKAMQNLVEYGPTSAATYVRIAQRELANIAEKLTLAAARR